MKKKELQMETHLDMVTRALKQRSSVDYNETFSPAVRFDSLRIIMSFTASRCMRM